MRTETFRPFASAVARLRGQTRRLTARAPWALSRWPIGLAALAAIAALVYAATTTPNPVAAFVRSGETFSADDQLAIKHALDAKHIPCRIDSEGRVQVSAETLDSANDAVAKLDAVGKRRLEDIKKERDQNTSWLDTPEEKQERVERARNETLAYMISNFPDIVKATVIVNRPKPRGVQRTAQPASAFVWLETRSDRKISHGVVKSIQDLIAGNEPEVKPGAMTIIDRTGHSYLDAKDPSLGALNRKRAREEKFRDEIAEKLVWLKGAQVSVQLIPPVEASGPPPLAPSPEPPPPPAAEEMRLPEPPTMTVNRPMELLPDDPRPAPDPNLEKKIAPPPAPNLAITATTDEGLVDRSRARVLVQVPRSYYRERMPSPDPSLDDRQAFITRTETNIQLAVSIVVPPDQLGEVKISTIPDELPATSPLPAAGADARRVLSWWIPAGITGAATAAAIAVALRLLAVRRPSLRPALATRDERGRYKIDEADAAGPGPTERVRELIRQNPEAAASVLHRWTGQGGTIG